MACTICIPKPLPIAIVRCDLLTVTFQVKSSLLDNLVVGRPNSTINDNASQ